MEACFYGEYNQKLDEIVRYWNGKKIIRKNIGRIGGNKFEDLNADGYLNEVSEHLFKIPFSSSFKFTEPMVNRFKREIDNIEKSYTGGRIGTFKKYFYVADAIANHSPVSRKFYHEVNDAINFERNHMDQYLSAGKDIHKYITDAMIEDLGMNRLQVRKYKADMAAKEEAILKAGEGEDVVGLYKEYNSLYNQTGGEVTRKYIELMEMDKPTFAAEKNKYSVPLINAVERSRNLLNDMGGVLIQGLNRTENVIKMLTLNPQSSKISKGYLKRIKEAKERIALGIKEGGYLPHYQLNNIVELNYKVRKISEEKNSSPEVLNNNLGEITGQIETMIPREAKGRNETINNIWSKNPYFILTQYSKDVIAFNKINYIQEAYIPAMRKFQKADVNPEFIKSMRNYLEDTFQIATKGMLERPTWVNSTVRSLMAVETLKSMGLSVTGAIRNGASALYFFTESGVLSARNALKRYQGDNEVKEALNRIEAEQGYQFSESGRELVNEGLIPSTVNVSDIVFDPIKGKVAYRDKGVLKTLDPMIDKVVGGSLVFHRMTENLTRKYMFRIAWVQAYDNLKGHSILNPNEAKPGTEAFDKKNTRKIERMATRFALKAVNNFAFEYAAHAKARVVGGTAPMGKLGPDGLPKMKGRDYATALGEMGFQFMHYPMSFLNLQSKILYGAKDAYLSKQYDAPEIKQALRFAGLNMAVATLSIAANLDFRNTLDNDTVSRILDLGDYFTSDEEELKGKKRGLINDFSGPIVGDLLYAANMFQLYEMPDENWKKMLTGYIDYYDEGHVPDWVDPDKKIDTAEKRHMWNKLNVQLGRFMTKTGPAIRDGRGMDVVRHELGWYPTKFTKESRKSINKYSKNILGFKPFKDSKRRKGKDENIATKQLLKLSMELRGQK